MKPALAVFDLGELDEMTALICDLETREIFTRIEDEPGISGPFADHVKAKAAELGFEVKEWDRRALGVLA